MIVLINLLIMWGFCYFGWWGIKYKFRQWKKKRADRRMLRKRQRMMRKGRYSTDIEIIDGGDIYPEPPVNTSKNPRLNFRNR